MLIEINDLAASRLDKDFLKKIAKRVLKRESVGHRKQKFELSIALVGRAEIKKLNKEYRRKDKITDVLSFRYDNSGEIVICVEEIRKNAKRFGLTFKKELARILIHGLLHLSGYAHEKSLAEAEKMRKKEEYYIKLLWQNYL